MALENFQFSMNRRGVAMCRKLKISEHAQKSQLFKILIAIFNMAEQQRRALKFAEGELKIINLKAIVQLLMSLTKHTKII